MSACALARTATLAAMAAGALLFVPPAQAADRPRGVLVVAYDHELWRVPLPRARVGRISRPLLEREASPTLAPAGNLLAFARIPIFDAPPRVLLRPLPDGPARVIAEGSSPTFSPSGAELAFQTTAGVQAADLTTGAIRPITDDPSDRDPAWSTDDVLAFARGDRGRNGVMTVAPDGQGLRRAVWSRRRDVGIIRPKWSPDGRRLVVTLMYARKDRQRPRGWCGSATRSLRTRGDLELSLAVCDGHAAWSPDGSAIALQGRDSLRLVWTGGRLLDRFCEVGIRPRGLAWTGPGPVEDAGRRATFRLRRHCPPPPPRAAVEQTRYCFRVRSGDKRILRCVKV